MTHKPDRIKDNYIALSILLLLDSLFLSPLMANDSHDQMRDQSVEYKVKAAYLYNFTKFIHWQDFPADQFSLCLLGSNPLASVLTPIQKRFVKDKPIRLHYLNLGDSIEHCQMVYSHQNAPIVLSPMTGVLTIGEGELFTRQGGMIAFLHRQGKIKLQINLSAFKTSGLKISAKLLEVADIIEVGGRDD